MSASSVSPLFSADINILDVFKLNVHGLLSPTVRIQQFRGTVWIVLSLFDIITGFRYDIGKWTGR